MKTESVHEGMTMDHIPLGFGIVVVGILALSIHPIISIILIPIGISVFLITSGIEINPKKQSIRRYFSILGMKWGKWQDLSTWQEVKLILSVDTKETRSLITGGMGVVGPLGQKSSIRTFDMIVTYNDQMSKPFNHFLKYKYALKTIENLAQFKHLNIINVIELNLKLRRSTRRR